MSKVSKVKALTREEAAGSPVLPAELQLELADVATSAREGLLAVSVAAGLRVMDAMMRAELDAIVGPRHAKLPHRTAHRYGTTRSSVVLGARRVPVTRPRARTIAGDEVALETFQTFADDDLLSEVVVERMLAGLATRRHVAANEPVGDAVEASSSATSRSAVSRRFVKATSTLVDELLHRDLSDIQAAVLMIDGIVFADQCCVVALVISTDGTKIPVGVWLGDTENKTVVTDLLADLVDRGLRYEHGILVVIDGAKALAAGVRKVFGVHALIQRCTLHKRRNVAGYLPKDAAAWVDRKLAAAFTNPRSRGRAAGGASARRPAREAVARRGRIAA